MRNDRRQTPVTGLVAALLSAALFLAAPAHAACVDLPARLLMLASQGASVKIVDLDQAPVTQIKLDCTLAARDWGKLALTRHLCTGTSVVNPNGGQCKIVELAPLKGEPMSEGGFELAVRRNLAE